MRAVFHVYYLRRVTVVATFLLRLLTFAGEGKILIALIKFQCQQSLHDRNIVTLRETDVSWTISCDENINLIYHKLQRTYALVHMLSSKIEKALWAEKTTKTRCGMRETATTRNFALWKLQWRQWEFRTESHLQTLSEKLTWPNVTNLT
jgi:hypothetical protein